MSVYLVCEQCDKRLKIPEDVVGRMIKCPACGGVFKSDPSKVLPGKSAPRPVVEERQPVAVAPQRAAHEEEDEDVVPVRKKAPVFDEEDDEVEFGAVKKKAPPPEDDEDVLPAKKKAPVEEEDGEDAIVPAKKRSVVEDEDEEDAIQPVKKKPAVVEDEEDEDDRPVKRKRAPYEDEDEEDDDEDEKPKKAKRRTPWYVMLPLIVLSLVGGAGVAGLWVIGFAALDMDRHLNLSYETKMWIGLGAAGAVTLLCMIFSLVPLRAWLRFLLVFLLLGLGYGGSFAAMHWWKDLGLPEEEKPAPQGPPPGQPGGVMGGQMGGGQPGGQMGGMPPGGMRGGQMGGGQPGGPGRGQQP